MLLKPPVGMIAMTTDPRVIAASCSAGIVLYQLDSHQSTLLAAPECGRECIAYNDGKVSPDGRLWAATYDTGEVEPRGTLWALQSGRPPQLIDSGIAVVNGPAFAPDGRVMYVSDSIGRRILAYDITPGAPSRRRVFARMTSEEGLPDGLTVDAEGAVWCAHWSGGRVTRFAPDGARLMMIPLPVLNVTSVTFGGADLRTLFITTGWYGLNEQQRTRFAESGNLFATEPGVSGLQPTPLSLPFRPSLTP